MEKEAILLVEDDEPVRRAIRNVLTQYTVLEASSLAEARKHLEDPISLAIIDYSLPDCTGFDMLKAAKERKPDLLAIMITAYSTEDLVIRACGARFVDYLKKPLRLGYLKYRVSEILAGKSYNEHSGHPEDREEFFEDLVSSYIETHHMEECLLDKLAQKVYMNKCKFSRVFKERFGISFISYLNTVRSENAAHLINNFELRISEIAHHVGYRSISYFGKGVQCEIRDVSP